MNNLSETRLNSNPRKPKSIPGLIILCFVVLVVGMWAVVTQGKMSFQLVMLACFGIVGLWFTYHNPILLTALAIVTQFMGSVYVPGLSYGRYGVPYYMFFAAMALLAYGLRSLTGKESLRLPVGNKYWFVWMAFVVFSLARVGNPLSVLGSFVRPLFNWVIIFLVIQAMKDRQGAKRFLRWLVLQAVVMVIWWIFTGVRIYAFNTPTYRLFLWRMYQKNNFAVYLSFVLVSSLSLFHQAKKPWVRYLALFLIGAVPIAWAVSYSRSGLLALVASVLVYFFLDRRSKVWKQAFLVGVLVLCLIGVVFTIAPQSAKDIVVESIASVVTLGEASSERFAITIKLRIELLASAVDVALQHPIFGVGFDQWKYYSPLTTTRIDVQTNTKEVVGYSIHNRLVALMVNSGMIASGMYVLFIINLLVVAIRLLPHVDTADRSILIAFIAGVVGVQVGLQFAQSVIWESPMLGLLAGLINIIDAKMYPFHQGRRMLRFK